MDYTVILQALWLILPAYVANASAMLVGGGTSVDFGKTWRDGRRILGDGKTWRGLFVGGFIGMTAGFGLAVAARYIAMSDFAFLNLSDFEGFPLMIPIIFSLCFGALIGDVVESFFKRRIGKNRGEDWFFFDQIDFIAGALFFSFLTSLILQASGAMSGNWFLESFFPWHILVLIIITPFVHLISNFLHKKMHSNNEKR
ncbi:MAG: CDP-2,3-bis-(O-geranylgeranyl)-sn-glycerol synthase [Thermoplasmatales archaeon]|nr:MAG: CDP-2,3-bis-(O-geranylgeranyl)-sn-glycerol synthase [Thermoplasmatales archaeon]